MEYPLGEIRELVPETCSYCVDMTSEFSDVSVGVVEGRPEMNTLIVRTPRGRRLVDEAEREGWLVVEDMPEENIRHLMWAAANKKRRAVAKGEQKGIVCGPDEDGIAVFRMSRTALDAIRT
jgi:coenzyme F420 hydrogenase subunit beta